jgi:tripartite-type tricarboxylate transporter receptor subunit TctC
MLLRSRIAWGCNAAILSLAMITPPPAEAQTTDWPRRTVTTVIGFAVGGNSDALARLLTQRMTAQLKQPFVVDARVGAGGAIAMRSVGQAEPDGYTIFFAAAPQIGVVPHIQKLNFDPLKELTPVSAFATGPFLLVVNVDTPVKTLAEFVALAKQRRLNYGTGGVGSNSHMTAALAALAGRQIDFMFGNASEVVPQADNGKLRIIAVAAETRMKQLPHVPTLSETYPNTTVPTWNGVMVPARTPKPIIDKIAAQVIAAARDPEMIEKLARLGLEPDGNSPEEFAAQIRREQPVFDAAIKAAGLQSQ